METLQLRCSVRPFSVDRNTFHSSALETGIHSGQVHRGTHTPLSLGGRDMMFLMSALLYGQSLFYSIIAVRAVEVKVLFRINSANCLGEQQCWQWGCGLIQAAHEG